jgi:hypothetical protein
MSEDLKDFFLPFIWIVGITLIFVAFILFLDYQYQKAACPQKWSDFETRMSFMAGCQVKIGDKFVPENSVKFQK